MAVEGLQSVSWELKKGSNMHPGCGRCDAAGAEGKSLLQERKYDTFPRKYLRLRGSRDRDLADYKVSDLSCKSQGTQMHDVLAFFLSALPCHGH